MSAERKLRWFLDPRVLSRLATVPLSARRPMRGLVSGRHSSPHRGSSIEFAEYREYTTGDDPRRLDWRAYGRTDRFYIKEYEADTNLRCSVVLDTSGSMEFGSAGVIRLDYARKLAGSLAYLAVQQGDAVGLSCVADGLVRHIPPRRHPAHLKVVFDALEQVLPQGPTRLAAVLHELAETIARRALVVIISDFLIEPNELRSCCQHLRFRQHDVAAFHLLDPLELSFHFRRPMRFLDMEGGPAVDVEPNLIAERYHEALRTYLTNLRQVMLESAVDYHCVNLAEDYEGVLMRFLVGRVRGKGAR